MLGKSRALRSDYDNKRLCGLVVKKMNGEPKGIAKKAQRGRTA
jgi:hypothetical protein